MRGRKPLPKHLRLVQGNRGKRPIKADSKSRRGLRYPWRQPFLCEDAKVEWGQGWRQCFMRCDCMSELDVAALAAYCEAYATWKHAHEVLNEMAKHDVVTKALIVKSIKGNRIEDPILGIANAAAANMVKYASEFALKAYRSSSPCRSTWRGQKSGRQVRMSAAERQRRRRKRMGLGRLVLGVIDVAEVDFPQKLIALGRLRRDQEDDVQAITDAAIKALDDLDL